MKALAIRHVLAEVVLKIQTDSKLSELAGCPLGAYKENLFELPKGAIRVYASEKYENQTFVYGKAVGLQFHIEVDQSMVKEWAELYRDELQRANLEFFHFYVVFLYSVVKLP